jgi:TM2 domain-containing membrane protein YozV/type II secretory pathway pseudopilin PulG
MSETDMVFCRGCGKQLHKTALACPHCGAPQNTSKGGKSKTTAALLALFLGNLGIHRFYLGQWWGVFYLLFCWTFIPAFVALIEAIVFACTDSTKWDNKYNNGMPSGNSGAGVIIALIVGVIIVIAMVGILAAVAIPAYQTYTVKAKVFEAHSLVNQATTSVGAYMEQNHKPPESLAIAGFSKPLPAIIQALTIDQENGQLTATLTGPLVADKSFVFRPKVDQEHHITWECASVNVPNQYMPKQCQQ